jgi:hypothetical protein
VRVPKISIDARRALTTNQTILGFELIEGKPGEPNSKAIRIKLQNGVAVIVSAYSGGEMIIETVEPPQRRDGDDGPDDATLLVETIAAIAEDVSSVTERICGDSERAATESQMQMAIAAAFEEFAQKLREA